MNRSLKTHVTKKISATTHVQENHQNNIETIETVFNSCLIYKEKHQLQFPCLLPVISQGYLPSSSPEAGKRNLLPEYISPSWGMLLHFIRDEIHHGEQTRELYKSHWRTRVHGLCTRGHKANKVKRADSGDKGVRQVR